jgi:hypothetical protein
MEAKKTVEKLPSERSDTMSMSVSRMDSTNSGLRSEACVDKNSGKDATATSNWKVVTARALKDLHADSPFFASNLSRPLPCFAAKGKGKLK